MVWFHLGSKPEINFEGGQFFIEEYPERHFGNILGCVWIAKL